MALTAFNMARNPLRVVLGVGIDADDPEFKGYDWVQDKHVFEDRTQPAYANDVLWQIFPGDFYMLCGDDMRFMTPEWDRLLIEAMPDDGIGCVWPHDGMSKNCVFPCVTQKWIQIVGYLTPPYVRHWFCDTWIMDIAMRCRRARYCEHVHCEHLHPYWGKGAWDVTYTYQTRESGTVMEQDRQVFANYGEHREQKAVELMRQAGKECVT